jgi:hypothetical protein
VHQEISDQATILQEMADDFYCRYYVGHKGRFGHEYMEFEITSDGRLRYANNSNYKNDTMIRKEGTVQSLTPSSLIKSFHMWCFFSFPRFINSQA